MKNLGIVKFPLIIFLSLIVASISFLLLHDVIALLTGAEEKVFYFLFIVIFFILPFSFLILIISIIIEHGRKKYLINKKLRDEREDRELGIRT